MPKFSVIILFIDEKENIERSVAYMDKQTLADKEVEIILVNGLGKCVQERLSTIEQADPENVMLVMADEGASKSELLNVGMDYATGDYVFFLRAGDALNVRLFENVSRYSGSGVDIISFGLTRVHDSFEFWELEPFDAENIAVTYIDSPYAKKKFLSGDDYDERYLCNAYNLGFLRDVGQIFAGDAEDDDMSFAYPLYLLAGSVMHTNDHGYCRYERYERLDLDDSATTDRFVQDITTRISSRMTIQIELLELLGGIPELYKEYKDLIDAHFFREYYLRNMELVKSAKVNETVFIDLFPIMKMVLDKVLPDWSENEFLSALCRQEAETVSLLYDMSIGAGKICKILEKAGLVSVIIATHNRAQYIRKSIECVLMQTWKNLELIIIDDGSTDNTEEIVKEFADDRIIYLRNAANKGVSYSRNRGISASNGRYIVYQDDDDLCRLDKIEKQVLFMEMQSANVGMAYCMTLNHAKELNGILNEPVIRIPDNKRFSEGLDGFLLPRLLGRNFVACTAMVIRKECFDKVGLFDETLFAYEDWDMTLRLAREYDVGYIDEPLYDYYQRRTGLASNQDPEHRKHVIKALYDIDVKYKNDREKYGVKSKFVLKTS
jgi:glycosyltransferase involved in cell wall biosynthesis